MDPFDPAFLAAARRRNVLLTAVMLGILVTPAWLTPRWFALPWLIGVVLLGAPSLWLAWRHAPWVPTPAAEMPRLLAAFALTADERFVDLGCGDGRLVVRVHHATGASCTGIEASPVMWALAWLRAAIQARRGTTIRFGDLYRADLTGFDVIYVWGTAYSVSTERFAALVRPALAAGARVVSYQRPIPGFEPVVVDEGGQRPIYVYDTTRHNSEVGEE